MDIDKQLIVNADDFGQSHGVNSGIAVAHERGVVTSASLMVRWPAAAEAAAYAQAHQELSVGLHLDFGEWIFRNGEWVPLYTVVKDNEYETVAKEIEDQMLTFRRLMGANPTHIDSHQHFHHREPARSIVLELAHGMHIPVRGFSSTVRYIGRFYGQTGKGLPYEEGISVENLLRILEDVPAGCTEIGCHPAKGKDLNTMYLVEREQEVKTLCNPLVRETIAKLGIRLSSYPRFEQVSSTA